MFDATPVIQLLQKNDWPLEWETRTALITTIWQWWLSRGLPGHPWKFMKFPVCDKCIRIHQSCPQGHRKTSTNDSGTNRIPFLQDLFYTQRLFLEPQTSRLRPWYHQKMWHGNNQKKNINVGPKSTERTFVKLKISFPKLCAYSSLHRSFMWNIYLMSKSGSMYFALSPWRCTQKHELLKQGVLLQIMLSISLFRLWDFGHCACNPSMITVGHSLKWNKLHNDNEFLSTLEWKREYRWNMSQVKHIPRWSQDCKRSSFQTWLKNRVPVRKLLFIERLLNLEIIMVLEFSWFAGSPKNCDFIS